LQAEVAVRGIKEDRVIGKVTITARRQWVGAAVAKGQIGVVCAAWRGVVKDDAVGNSGRVYATCIALSRVANYSAIGQIARVRSPAR
jgi:hypothetical protein